MRAPSMRGSPASPCVTAHNHRKTACTDNVCMRAIAVNQVYVAVTDILSAPSAAQERRAGARIST